ncbi:type I polyketide synthase, partial [Streptomyces coffeae]
MLTAVAELFVFGTVVDWGSVFAGCGARPVELPTYAFQRERFWMRASRAAADASSLGLGAARHPLLGASLAVAGSDAMLLTSRLSTQSCPYFVDHVVAGSVLLPGTAFVELAVQAGDRAGCGRVEELTLQAPLVLPEQGAVQVQISIDSAEDGRRELRIYSRAEEADEEQPWTLHATGTLTAGREAVHWDLRAWPPADAERVSIEGLYERLSAAGLDYGPAFRGLHEVWKQGENLFVEAILPEHTAADASGFGLHPALLDTVLHALALQEPYVEGAQLPFSWSGVSLSAVGASAVRVQLTPRGAGKIGLRVADVVGDPVAEIDSLVLRTVQAADLAAADSTSAGNLFRLEWTPVPSSAGSDVSALGGVWVGLGEPGEWRESGVPVVATYPDLGGLVAALDGGVDVPEVVLLQVCRGVGAGVTEAVDVVLGVVREWLGESRLAGSRLVVVTSGAVVEAEDVAGAGVWGLLRSAMSEHPDRFVLADVDGERASYEALAASLAGAAGAGEGQLAVRGGQVLLPRLARISGPGDAAPAWRTHGTVLVTGGTGGLGAVVARHLVEQHGVRDLLLLSRRGIDAPGAAALEEELTGLGARVTVAACDVSDREAVTGVLDAIPADVPLRGVVHAAGVLDDGLVSDLTSERLGRVLAAKAESAVHLHELTRDRELDAFVLFSSFAGVVGNAGQAAYAAANAVLDGLAVSRRAQGLPAVSLAWGMWEHAEGMGSRLSDADVARLRRQGFPPLPTDDALALLDTALHINEPVALPIAINTTSLARYRDSLPGVLRSVVPAVRRRRVAGQGGADGGSALARKLRGLPVAEQERVVVEVVRSQVAAVLGHASATAVDPVRAFKDLGFDSLTAVELRNQLNAVTGLRLPATLLFDHPSVGALAGFLREQLLGADGSGVSREAGSAVAGRAVGAFDEPIAIVGMGCRYPGGVGSPEALWGLVESGGDGISFFPGDRGWDVEGLFDPDG